MTVDGSKPSQPDQPTDPTLRALRVSIGAMFLTLIATGLLLMTVYNPSTSTAWGSVWYIQTQMTFGWLIRGLHYFASEAILVLALVYVACLVIKHRYCGRGGGLWAMSLGVVAIALGASLTGHLLPWDQEGYWGTVVRTNILARTPVVGDILRQLVLGGSAPGNFTLARFYMLHVIVLPLLASPVLLWLPIFHGRLLGTKKKDAETSSQTWPIAQISLSVIAILVIAFHFGTDATLLAAPADASVADYPARPEWHTLFLFQWLKFFEGPTAEMVASIVAPGIVFGLLAMLPLFEIVFPRRGRTIAVWYTTLLLAGAVGLTADALVSDMPPSAIELSGVRARQSKGEELSDSEAGILRSELFQHQLRNAREMSNRAVELASSHGIPPSGPLELLANDPQTRGPQLFAANCSSCHRFNGHDGAGVVPTETATSSDLGGFASRQWIRRLLNDPAHDRYFGLMKKPGGEPAHTKMARWVKTFRAENAEDQDAASRNLDAVSRYLESEARTPGRFAEIDAYSELADDPSTGNERALREGRLFFMQTCNECHTYNGHNEGTTRAPEFFGYGSVEWLTLMIAEPDHKTRYRKSGKEPAQMPRFSGKLSDGEISLIARWIHESGVTAP